jgi:hypothetical protein
MSYRRIELEKQLTTTGNVWLWFLFLGCPYGAVGKWGLQILFWFTGGGLGIWTLITMFRVSTLVENHNRPIRIELESIERKEKEEADAKQLAMIAAMKS